MASIGIQYVDKLANGHEHITHLGSATQRFTREAVIKRLRAKTDTFYVAVGNDVALLEVVEAARPYVRTVPDATRRDNLLSLPPCPGWLPLVA